MWWGSGWKTFYMGVFDSSQIIFVTNLFYFEMFRLFLFKCPLYFEAFSVREVVEIAK